MAQRAPKDTPPRSIAKTAKKVKESADQGKLVQFPEEKKQLEVGKDHEPIETTYSRAHAVAEVMAELPITEAERIAHPNLMRTWGPKHLVDAEERDGSVTTWCGLRSTPPDSASFSDLDGVGHLADWTCTACVNARAAA